MIFTYPALISPNVDERYLKGILKTLENYYLYHMTEALHTDQIKFVVDHKVNQNTGEEIYFPIRMEGEKELYKNLKYVAEDVLYETVRTLSQLDAYRYDAMRVRVSTRLKNIHSMNQPTSTKELQDIVNDLYADYTKDLSHTRDLLVVFKAWVDDNYIDGVIEDAIRTKYVDSESNVIMSYIRATNLDGRIIKSNNIKDAIDILTNMDLEIIRGKDRIKRDIEVAYRPYFKAVQFRNNVLSNKIMISQDVESITDISIAKNQIAAINAIISTYQDAFNFKSVSNIDDSLSNLIKLEKKRLEKLSSDLDKRILKLQKLDVSMNEIRTDVSASLKIYNPITYTNTSDIQAIEIALTRIDALVRRIQKIQDIKSPTQKVSMELNKLIRDLDVRHRDLVQKRDELTLEKEKNDNDRKRKDEADYKDVAKYHDKEVDTAIDVAYTTGTSGIKLNPVDSYISHRDIETIKSVISELDKRINALETDRRSALSRVNTDVLVSKIEAEIGYLQNYKTSLQHRLSDLEQDRIISDEREEDAKAAHVTLRDKNNLLNSLLTDEASTIDYNLDYYNSIQDIDGLRLVIQKLNDKIVQLEELYKDPTVNNAQNIANSIQIQMRMFTEKKYILTRRLTALLKIDEDVKRNEEIAKKDEEERRIYINDIKGKGGHAKFDMPDPQEFNINPSMASGTAPIWIRDIDTGHMTRDPNKRINIGIKIMPILMKAESDNIFRILRNDLYSNRLQYLYKASTRVMIRKIWNLPPIRMMRSLYGSIFGEQHGKSGWSDILLKDKGYMFAKEFKKTGGPTYQRLSAGILIMSDMDLGDGESNFFDDSSRVKRLFSMGWNSFVFMNDQTHTLTFCSYLEQGMCTRVPYAYLFKKGEKLWDSLESLKRYTGNVMGKFKRVNYKRITNFINKKGR